MFIYFLILTIYLKVAENIDIKVPEEGLVIKRLVELAKERNISYNPSHDSLICLNDYCNRKGIPVRTLFIILTHLIESFECRKTITTQS